MTTADRPTTYAVLLGGLMANRPKRVEEAAPMGKLVIAERAGGDWFEVETLLAREKVGGGRRSYGPGAAGGNL